MRISDIDRMVFEWVLNALWQIGLLTLVAVLVQPLLRSASAHFRHYYWVAASSLCVVIPILSLVFLGLPGPGGDNTLSVQALAGPPSTSLAPLLEPPAISVPGALPQCAAWAYAACLGVALLGFGRSLLAVKAFRKKAKTGCSDSRLDDIVTHCAAVFGVSGARAFATNEVHSPITFGFRKPLILVPSDIVRTSDYSTLVAVIGHEMAHIKRKDFFVNLLAQLLVIPVQFHPLTWYLGGKIRRQCELACDEMVTASLMSKRVYARRLLEVAAESIKGGTMKPQFAFGSDSLEERIRALVAPSKSVRSRWMQRAVMMSGCFILVLAGAGTGLIFVRAQDGPAPAGQEQTTASGDDKVYQMSDKGVVAPKILKQTIPSYTEGAQAAGIQGAVALGCVIRTTGRVTDCQVVRSLDKELDDATIKEIQDNWRFSPATVEGKPVDLRATIEVNFALRSNPAPISTSEAEGLVIEWIELIGLSAEETTSAHALMKMHDSTKFQTAAFESDTKKLTEKFGPTTGLVFKGNSGGVVVKYRFTAR